MPQNKIIKIKDYSVKTTDVYFFDNSVWMYLFCPIANHQSWKQKAYSKFLQYLMGLKRPIFINSLVLSEFANRYLRLDYNLTRGNPENAGKFGDFKKDFLGSTKSKETIAEIKRNMENMLKIAEKCSDEFNSLDTTNLLDDFMQIGFNDSYYIQLACQKKWILVSDDSDFTNDVIPPKNLTIITA